MERRRPATLAGRRRAFWQIYSVHHRGTYERPGLVLGLAPGGSVRGAAYRIAPNDWAEVYAYLIEREQPTETYVEARRWVRLDDGRRVEALVFLSGCAPTRQWGRRAQPGAPGRADRRRHGAFRAEYRLPARPRRASVAGGRAGPRNGAAAGDGGGSPSPHGEGGERSETGGDVWVGVLRSWMIAASPPWPLRGSSLPGTGRVRGSTAYSTPSRCALPGRA